MRKNKGFTLVELIVVLVILAILAAILVPTLLGYIDKARQKKDINKAKACLDAAQAVFTEAYGKNMGVANKNVLGLTDLKPKPDDYGDINCAGSFVEEKVMNYVDDSPYIFVVGVGNCNLSDKVTKHQMYTVCYAIYVPEKDARPYYYYNGEWTTENATNIGVVSKEGKINTLIDGDKKLPIQYYVISNKDNLAFGSLNSGTFWGYLRRDLPKMHGDVELK